MNPVAKLFYSLRDGLYGIVMVLIALGHGYNGAERWDKSAVIAQLCTAAAGRGIEPDALKRATTLVEVMPDDVVLPRRVDATTDGELAFAWTLTPEHWLNLFVSGSGPIAYSASGPHHPNGYIAFDDVTWPSKLGDLIGLVYSRGAVRAESESW